MAPASSTGSRLWHVAKYGISFALIAYLAVSVDWPSVWASVRTVSVPWLLISLSYIPAGVILVASRYHRLIHGLISYRAMLRLVVLQTTVSTFLANAAGSLGYIAMLVKFNRVPAELAVQSTIIARLGDLFASLIVAGMLVAPAWSRLERIHSLVLLAMLVSIAVLVFAAVAIAVARRTMAPTVAGTSSTQGASPTLWRRVVGFGMGVIRLDPGYVGSILPTTLLYSFLLQAVIAVAMYCSARAFHLDIGFFEAALVGVVSSFVAALPIAVFGGLGVYEVTTVGLLAVFGVPIEAATGMILVVRTIYFLVIAAALVIIRPPSQR